MRMKMRVVSLILALLMLLPMGAVGVSAASDEYALVSFEPLEVGALTLGGTYFARVPNLSEVREEGENQYLRIPFVGSYQKDATTNVETVTGNCESGLQVKHTALDKGVGFTLEVDYRPHYNGAANAMVEVLFDRYTFTAPNGDLKENADGDLTLFYINLKDGSLTGCGTLVKGSAGMKLDEWNRLMLTYHPEDGKYEIYINGALYSRMENPRLQAGKLSFVNCKNIHIYAQQLIVARCVKNADAYTERDEGEATNYIDVDNVRLYKTNEAKVTLNGEETFVNLDVGLDLSHSEKKLLYAEVTHPGKSTFYTAHTSFPVETGTVINTRYVGLDTVKDDDFAVRVAGGVGLRYLTAINKVDYEGLGKDEKIKSYTLGTAILPADLLAGKTLDAETLESVKHLEIPVKEGAWYSDRLSVRYCHTFAGSIVKIKEENANREFIGVGYVRVTMQNGTTLTLLAQTEPVAGQIMSFAAYKERNMNMGLEKDAREALAKYEARMMEELKGLNVLALGDSLFGGTGGYPQSTQWVNKLGRDCSWNLTNLGTSSMTVSLTKYNNQPDHGNKNSMYDWLFNNKNDFRWGSTSKHTSPHPFFSCGDISGDPNDVDLIIFEGGCNDYGTAISAPLGTVDSRDSGTFLGAWNLITERLLAEYPNATIVFLTSWRFNGSQQRENDTLTSREYSESVITLYEEKYADNDRIALIDAGDPEVSGVDMTNTAWREKYSTDSYHLKDTGMALMACNMLPLLWKIVKE